MTSKEFEFLTSQQLSDIRRHTDVSAKDMAKRFGVKEATVLKVRSAAKPVS